jgi:hypothetical protein
MLTPEERRQRELVDGLRTDIRALAHSLDVYAQALKATETSRDASYQQAEDARVRAVVLEQIQAERNATEAKGKKKEWSSFEKGYLAVQVLLLLATAGAFGAAYWYARIADIQKNTMISQTPKIAKSADAAESAAKTASLTTRLDERAWLTIKYLPIPMSVGSRVSVPLTFENTGKTAAKNLVGVIAVSIIDADAVPDFTYVRGYYSWNSGYLSQGTQDTMSWNALDRKTRKDIILTGPENDAVRSGTRVITINGKIDYDDIFGIHHWVTFCQQSAAPVNGMRIKGTKECSAYDQIDSNQ